jgi:dihydropteroate synthase
LDEELGRVIPAIERIRKELGEVLISVDTYKASVAEAALEAGANWVNDIWGLKANPEMAKVISKYNAHVVIMHNRHTIKSVSTDQGLGGHYTEVEYHNLIEVIKNKLMESVSLAREAGIPDANIILDPGIGFGKTVEQNLILINHLDAIVQLGFPVLLGTSRKSFIGYTLNLPSDSRLEGSLAANAIGILRGASILRVHDVLETVRMAKMVDAILKT